MSDPVADPVEFARLLGRDPWPHQIEALRSRATYRVPVGGRRSGKSETAQYAALHGLFTHRDSEWLVTGPTEEKAQEFVAEAADLLSRSELGRGAVLDEASKKLTLRNGSEMIVKAPTPGKIRGKGRRVIGVTIEEAGFCPQHVMRDARYTLLDNIEHGATAWLIGSPWGGRGHFFFDTWQLGMDGDPDVYAATWRTADNPRRPAGWIARERERLNAIEAMAELDGEWTEDGLRWFPPSLLDSCRAPIVLPPWSEVTGRARPIVTADWGKVYDTSASVLLYRLPGLQALNPAREPLPTFVVISKTWSAGTRLLDAAAAIADLRCSPSHYSLERSGVGEAPCELVRESPRLSLRPSVGRRGNGCPCYVVRGRRGTPALWRASDGGQRPRAAAQSCGPPRTRSWTRQVGFPAQRQATPSSSRSRSPATASKVKLAPPRRQEGGVSPCAPARRPIGERSWCQSRRAHLTSSRRDPGGVSWDPIAGCGLRSASRFGSGGIRGSALRLHG
jgi:hypothetical protein